MRNLNEQVAAICATQPDIIALQEVNKNAIAHYVALFAEQGYLHHAHGFIEGINAPIYAGRRTRGVLLISRWALHAQTPCNLPFQERIISVIVDSPYGNLELHNVYIPTGGVKGDAKWIKIETLEQLYTALARTSTLPRILCGDFNAPQAETAEGRLISFGESIRKDGTPRIIGTWGERWDRGERNILVGLAQYDLADVFRAVNGYADTQVYSWYTHKIFGFRLDHIFASASLNPLTAHYDQTFRTTGLSDHAAMLATFQPQQPFRQPAS